MNKFLTRHTAFYLVIVLALFFFSGWHWPCISPGGRLHLHL